MYTRASAAVSLYTYVHICMCIYMCVLYRIHKCIHVKRRNSKLSTAVLLQTTSIGPSERELSKCLLFLVGPYTTSPCSGLKEALLPFWNDVAEPTQHPRPEYSAVQEYWQAGSEGPQAAASYIVVLHRTADTRTACRAFNLQAQSATGPCPNVIKLSMSLQAPRAFGKYV